jgi:hypothetical protein
MSVYSPAVNTYPTDTAHRIQSHTQHNSSRPPQEFHNHSRVFHPSFSKCQDSNLLAEVELLIQWLSGGRSGGRDSSPVMWQIPPQNLELTQEGVQLSWRRGAPPTRIPLVESRF